MREMAVKNPCTLKLPRGVYRQRKRLKDGEVIYYRDRVTGKRVMGEPGTEEFEESFREIRATEKLSRTELRKTHGIARAYDRIYAIAGRPKTLAREEFEAMVARADGKCEVTGIPFDLTIDRPDWIRAPFAPSVDRIDPKGDYVAQNCRLVALAVNVALNQWGDEIFSKIASAYFQRKFAEGRARIEFT